MEVAESREPGSVGPPTGAESTATNGEQNPLLDDSLMDDRSSSLSEIDYVSENEPSDYEPSKPEKTAPENDSEAETERIEDSPHSARWRKDIVLSAAGSHNPSPSKLAQSTTYDEAEDEDEEDEEEHVADDSPSKPRSKNNGIAETLDETPGLDDSTLSDSISKKRKRLETGGDETGTEFGEDEPPNKRRGSVKSDLSDPPADALTPEPFEEPSKPIEDDTPADDVPESDLPAAPIKGRKGKKGKRKTRKTRDIDEETEIGAGEGAEGGADDHLGEDDDTADRGEDVDDAEGAAKHEEESAKKASAMDSLTELEKEFATLRDKIYDERISKLNRELEMLTGPNPTHPEYLRQLECVQHYRDAKIKYEHTLFQYRLKALLNKSLAERAQSHSTFFQRVRDIRERHSSAISKQFYAIQHDRFKTEEISPHHYIPFPTRRSQQIAHQAAYNQEVSVMAGVAKYVGFPAAPSLAPARPSELDEDLEKMGISVEPRISASQPPVHSSLPRSAMSALSSNAYRTAEEAFLEQTPWANPQHPIHQQQVQSRPQSRVFEHPRAPSYTTPAAQKRVVDVNAPNGSASTIAENPSAANSPANNTPYGTEQEQQPHHNGHFVHPDYDADRKSGFRSMSSSPLDMRKPHPSNNAFDHRSPPDMRPDTTRNNAFSPPPARLGLFHSATSKRESSPTLSSKPVNSVHQSTGVGTGSNQMTAR